MHALLLSCTMLVVCIVISGSIILASGTSVRDNVWGKSLVHIIAYKDQSSIFPQVYYHPVFILSQVDLRTKNVSSSPPAYPHVHSGERTLGWVVDMLTCT